MKVQWQVKTIGTGSVFHLPELPKRIVIQGNGCLALEFFDIFAGPRLERVTGLSR